MVGPEQKQNKPNKNNRTNRTKEGTYPSQLPVSHEGLVSSNETTGNKDNIGEKDWLSSIFSL